MNNFDLSAGDWDKNSVHTERSLAVARKLSELLEFKPGMKAMEFGAGTAILSFLLKDKLESITLIDNSREMIRVCNEKIAQTGSTNMKALFLDLETESPAEVYDLIYSQMAFHHVVDVEGSIRKLSALLSDKGILAIIDLYKEDGSFHGEGFTGHNGFDPLLMSALLQNAGFTKTEYSTCFVQKKTAADGSEKDYLVFLMIGRKNQK